MLVLGIDPGFQGALASVGESGGEWSGLVTDTPILKGVRPEYDIQAMRDLLKPYAAYTEIMVGIEEQGPRPFEGVVSVFRMGMGFGIWLGLLGSLNLRVHRINPAKWKREFGLLKTNKEASVVKAKELFPNISYHTKRGKALDGRAEALLIAEFTRRQVVRGEL